MDAPSSRPAPRRPVMSTSRDRPGRSRGPRRGAPAGDLKRRRPRAGWAEALGWRRGSTCCHNAAPGWRRADEKRGAAGEPREPARPRHPVRLAIGHFGPGRAPVCYGARGVQGGPPLVPMGHRQRGQPFGAPGDDAEHLRMERPRGCSRSPKERARLRLRADPRVRRRARLGRDRHRQGGRFTGLAASLPMREITRPPTSPKWWPSSPRARRTPPAPPSTSPAPTTCADDHYGGPHDRAPLRT